jgi:AraC-like DNA-binding protein
MALAEPAESDAPRLRPRELERMHAARELLLSRLADPPTLAEVASAIGTNDFALKRQFKAAFGQPVHAFLLEVRLAQARRQLQESGEPIKQIAAAVGYMHANHFSTAFRRAYGISPARYRARARRGGSL